MPSDQDEAFWAFYNTARKNDVLEEKTTFLVHLGVSMAVGCYPCMRYYLAQADDLGVTEEEIETVRSIAMAVSAGKVLMQYTEASNDSGGSCGPGC